MALGGVVPTCVAKALTFLHAGTKLGLDKKSRGLKQMKMGGLKQTNFFGRES